MAVKEDIELHLKYKGFMKNEGKFLNIDCSPEVVFTTDLIYVRYALIFAILKSAQHECSDIRKLVNNLEPQKERTKAIRDKIMSAALRTYKLKKAEAFIYQGLNTSS